MTFNAKLVRELSVLADCNIDLEKCSSHGLALIPKNGAKHLEKYYATVHATSKVCCRGIAHRVQYHAVL